MDQEAKPARPDFLAHRAHDHVAVAVREIEPGPAHGCVLEDDADLTVSARQAIPLGHKIALVDLEKDAEVIEYGLRIGISTAAIAAGDYVHTHNLRSARWQTSVAD